MTDEDRTALGVRSDYADAFTADVEAADRRTAEQVARGGLEGAPPPVRWLIWQVHRWVLGFDLGPRDSTEHILGWRIVSSTDEAVRLETSSRLFRGVLLAMRTDPTTARLVTSLTYDDPQARAVWRCIGPLHRRIAPVLLRHAVRRRTASASMP